MVYSPLFYFKGMVEKWLLQVEDTMLSSLRKVIYDSTQAYSSTPRKKWVLDWPGQVVLCVSQIFWTIEGAEAMKEKDGMKVSVKDIARDL